MLVKYIDEILPCGACNESTMTIIANPQDAIPSEETGLYDSEHGSDVTFVAGIDSDTWRFPGHRTVLAAANQVFRAMLCGPLSSGDDVIYVRDVDKRAFEQLMRFVSVYIICTLYFYKYIPKNNYLIN